MGRVAVGLALSELPAGTPVEQHTDGPAVLALLAVTDTRKDTP